MPNSSKQFGLAYLDAGEIGAYLESHSGQVLSVIGFGRAVALPKMAGVPLWADIPVLNGKDNRFEVWSSDAPVTPCEHKGKRGTSDGKVLFGSLSLEQRPGDRPET